MLIMAARRQTKHRVWSTKNHPPRKSWRSGNPQSAVRPTHRLISRLSLSTVPVSRPASLAVLSAARRRRQEAQARPCPCANDPGLVREHAVALQRLLGTSQPGIHAGDDHLALVMRSLRLCGFRGETKWPPRISRLRHSSADGRANGALRTEFAGGQERKRCPGRTGHTEMAKEDVTSTFCAKR
jgi:hypothetical protein